MFQECMESNGKDNSGGCYCGSGKEKITPPTITIMQPN